MALALPGSCALLASAPATYNLIEAVSNVLSIMRDRAVLTARTMFRHVDHLAVTAGASSSLPADGVQPWRADDR